MAIEVATAADLNNVRNNLSGDYIQTADIDLSGWGNWTPISTFTGTYDGGRHKITGLTIYEESRPAGRRIGLFGRLNGAYIKRVGLEDVNITALDYIGALVGDLYGAKSTIEECYSTGSVTGEFIVGGLLGVNIDTTIPTPTGPIAGDVSIDVINCYSMCTVTGMGDVAGIMGFAYQGPDVSLFQNCYYGGTLAKYSGFIGEAGVVNTYTAESGWDPSYEVNMVNCYYDSDKNGVLDDYQGSPRTTAEMTYPENFTTTFIDWDFTNIWTHDPTYTINDGYPPFGAGFNIWVKKSGAWQPVTDIWVRKGGAWQPVSSVDVNKDGWKPI